MRATAPLPSKAEVLIAGAGPVGMLLALLLAKRNISSLVIDPRTEIHPHSRAIGIHPPGLEALARAGVLPGFLEQGMLIPGGSVYVDDQIQGHLGFDQNPGKWKYPLLLSQQRTETLLEDACHAEPLINLQRGWSVHTFATNSRSHLVCCRNLHEKEWEVETNFLIGCDGKRSRVPEGLGIPWSIKRYPDQYLLGDLRDDTDFGDRAIIFLTRQGLVESFPLQKGWRRWVVHLETHELPPPLQEIRGTWKTTDLLPWQAILAQLIEQRTAQAIHPEASACQLVGHFGIERGLAERVWQDHAFLAGDAAHIVSPIGGQGMNLGWMDAVDLAETIDNLRLSPFTAASDAPIGAGSAKKEARIKNTYQRRVLQRARKGIRRAWFNTVWGRPHIPKLVRTSLVRAILTEPLRSYFTRQFTMTNLH